MNPESPYVWKVPTVPQQPEPTGLSGHLLGYPKFLLRAIWLATDGSYAFYTWMTVLTAVALVGLNAWAHQTVQGMGVTGMSDHVSWGLYIANFTFGVGIAAGAVMMVIPAYIYKDSKMHDIVIIGELLAISAIFMCLLFVNADLGRPDRFWHMMPIIGRFNWPISMLTWDVIVLSGYLVLNLHIAGYQLYLRFLGREPAARWYVPFVFISIFWAISIHTVTAFLYCGLGGRPFWNTALLAPRFLASAFVAGPAFIIIVLFAIKKFSDYKISDGPIKTLISIIRIALLVGIIMIGSELFTAFYTGGAHATAVHYLYFGLHDHYGLVPWAWSSLGLTLVAVALFYLPNVHEKPRILIAACLAAFVGLWIEKGMGMIIPAFVPSTMHEIVEYTPSIVEWKITAGVFAFGLLVLTAALKIALPVMTGRSSIKNPS
jgi:molybdopterin-containing oxidoreductase family membrane subunit